jgi:MFS family permease
MTDIQPTSISRPPPPGWFRWMVLVLISLAMFGNYYIYDAIGPLADVLTAQLKFTDSEIGLLNGIYSFPNIIMVLIGGIIVDRFGVKRSTLLFAVLCLLGAAITASMGNLTVMAIGRLVFGIGAESLIVAVTTAIARWFRGKELSFAFGINLTIARLGSYAAIKSTWWAGSLYESWRGPLLLSVGAGAICVLGAIIYWVLEDRAKCYDLGEAGPTDKVKFSDVRRVGASYWWIVGICFTFYSAIFPFQSTFGIKYFMASRGLDRDAASDLTGMLILFAMIATPIFGFIVDRIGRRTVLMMFGSFLVIPTYLLLAYTRVVPEIPMSILGVAFSLIPAVMWPSVAYIVGKERLGTALGLMTMIQNGGLAGFNVAIGGANDLAGAGPENPAGYLPMLWICASLGILAILFAFLLRRSESGPRSHGLDTITVASQKP